MRLRRITWRSHGTPPWFPEWNERYACKCWLEAQGARWTGWMLNVEVTW
jgi:hypothetical protein